MVSVAVLLIVLALIFCVLSIVGKLPLWVSVLLLILERLIALGPLG